MKKDVSKKDEAKLIKFLAQNAATNTQTSNTTHTGLGKKP